MDGDKSEQLARKVDSEADTQLEDFSLGSQGIVLRDESTASENMFPESPVYDPEPEDGDLRPQEVITLEDSVDPGTAAHQGSKEDEEAVGSTMDQDLPSNEHNKRKLSDGVERSPKVQKVESTLVDTQTLDAEVSGITAAAAARETRANPAFTAALQPVRRSPRKIGKRSNSCCDSLRSRAPHARCASADLHAGAGSPSRPSVIFVSETRPSSKRPIATVSEESADPNDSQNFHLELSPSTPDRTEPEPATAAAHSSEPTLVRDRLDALSPADVSQYSDPDVTARSLQSRKSRASDQDATDTASTVTLDSPDVPSTLSSKLITKLSNGDSSTPTDEQAKRASDATPDAGKLGAGYGKRFGKADLGFRASNSTTPSTISPLQNGHGGGGGATPAPRTPGDELVFDIHTGHDEDGELLTMYIVRTDHDLGQDMCREFQRVSKRFTMDPYLADISKSNSPSSMTSATLLSLPLHPPHPSRSSFTSTATSTSTSSGGNRTSDGAFVVPQPPARALTAHGSTGIRGYRALLNKINEMFAHVPDSADDSHRSAADDKVSAAVQVSPGALEEKHSNSNGAASPEEVNRCDRATPKSSLKKSKVRGRRPLPGKTKRALLPTQTELAEEDDDARSPEPSPAPAAPAGDEKVASAVGQGQGTPKSVSKVRGKRPAQAESPRPATPLDAALKPEPPPHPPGTLVLAKWVDKRYYSGRVQEMLEPNKYQIEFDDGHSKALLDEFIIFGDRTELPLRGQSVYAMVDDEQTYEPALVMSVEQNNHRTVTYRCTTDGEATVSVTATELYLTEDQARSLKESCAPRSPLSTPSTPRRRAHRELDLDNIIYGTRSARARKRIPSPRSPKASTSGIKGRQATPGGSARKRRPVSESSEVSEGSSTGLSAPPNPSVDEVAGVEPELQKTPRKIDGVKAGPLQLKGAAKQTVGKKNSKLNKFENDAETVSRLGPIPPPRSTLFRNLHFLLTCSTSSPASRLHKEVKHYSSEEDGDGEGEGDGGESTSTAAGTDHEDMEFSRLQYNKERLREQLEAGGGTVYSCFKDIPKHAYARTRVVAPRPCRTANYIECLAADVHSLSHDWVIASCSRGALQDMDSFSLPAGWSLLRNSYVSWRGRRSTCVFKDKVILLCGDPDTFVKFWERVCALVGAATRSVTAECPNLTDGLALVAEADCPHEVQNKANQDSVPLVSPVWVIQCLIEGRVCPPAAHPRFYFMYTEPE